MFSVWKDMHLLQSIQELHISKPFYKQVLTDTNGYEKLMFYTGFCEQEYFLKYT
ncbi:hypothetical protein Hdeb2414_s1228g00994321 [Helianthus debilis subsp. tardiflorus]